MAKPMAKRWQNHPCPEVRKVSPHQLSLMEAASKQPYFPFYPKDEIEKFWTLGPEASMLFIRLRLYSWTNVGFPLEPQKLRKICKFSLGISLKKFQKTYAEIAHFFCELEGSGGEIWVCADDESKRTEATGLARKRRMAGQLGAAARWGKGPQRVQKPPIVDIANPMANPMANGMANGMAKAWHTQTQTQGLGSSSSSVAPEDSINQEREPAATHPPVNSAGESEHRAGAAGSLPAKVLTKTAKGLIAARCIELGLQTPGPKVLGHLTEIVFPELPPEEIPELLVRFEGQDKTGLWLHRGRLDFDAEFWRLRNADKIRPPSKSKAERQAATDAVTLENLKRRLAKNGNPKS